MNASQRRKPLIVAPAEGRHYSLGRWHAVFKADGVETDSRYSISEWWLEPYSSGPGQHEHADDHIFYVIEGTLSLRLNEQWTDAERGTYALIPGGTPHDFANRRDMRCGFMSLNVPGGFEHDMPHFVRWFEENQTDKARP